jgi:ABC-type lipoprotein export system ATPase subunit
MGASGAGKTTLLNVLACRIDPEKGGKLYANNL